MGLYKMLHVNEPSQEGTCEWAFKKCYPWMGFYKILPVNGPLKNVTGKWVFIKCYR